VATHNPELVVAKEGTELVSTLAKRLEKRRLAGSKSLDVREALTYRFQKSSIKAEATRQWAIGLLDTFDNQRQRVLISFLDEFDSQLMFGTPAEPLRQTLEKEMQPLVSGEYVALLARDAAQLQQNMTQRAQKLSGGQTE
jgi:hypothetical protein